MWGSLNKPGSHGENDGNRRDMQPEAIGGELTADQRSEAERHAVEFLKKLRDEAHFDSLDALKAQIGRDTDEARCHFLQHASREGSKHPSPLILS